jgi:4-hydroxy-tetrahydrodipicolinate synthase
MFTGVITALVTPLRGGRVDEPALRRLVSEQIEAGVDGFVPVGTTGESPTLTNEEHVRVIEVVVEEVKKRVPVIAGTGSNSTREAIELTRHAKDAGADGALLLSPYYNKPTQEGIYAHYAAIAEATRFPLVLYNIPGRTASNIAPEIIARLARLEHVAGVKEASGSLDQMSHVIAKCPQDFAVLSGDDSLTLPLLAIGGKGVISTTSNVAPRQICDLVRRFQRGDTAGAQAVHYSLLPLFDVLFCETNPIPVKAAASELGWCGPEMRLPLTRITDANLERLKIVLKDLEILR